MAQVVGVFRWQFAPFCNVVTLTVEQKGAQYALTGFDDMCGGARRGAATGLAHPNPDGTIGLGITVVRPDGLAVQHSAAITLTTLSGTWSDEHGNSGTFVFNPPTPPAGQLRPLTIRGVYGAYGTPVSATASSTLAYDSISFGRSLPFTPQARVVPSGAAVTGCPGTALSPAAAPGFLCVYERSFSNRVNPIQVLNSNGSPNVADPFGAVVQIVNSSAANFGSFGTWAVTVP